MARTRTPDLKSLLPCLALLLLFLNLVRPTLAAAGSQNPFGDDDDDAVVGGAASANPPSYECPRDNGKMYTSNGITFQLQCDKGTTANRLLSTTAQSRTGCADLCAQNLQCKSCDYRDSNKQCVLFSQYIPTVPANGVHTWFPVKDPSVQRQEQAQKPAPQQPPVQQPPVQQPPVQQPPVQQPPVQQPPVQQPPVQQPPAQQPIAAPPAPPSQQDTSSDPSVLTPSSSGSSTASLPASNPSAPQGLGKCPEGR
ncbi:MAG: hypothetical protein Q9187_003510 [Circinaria calcarea]